MAKFEKGAPGRPKGCGVQAQYYNTLAKLRERGHDPIDAMILLAMDIREDRKLRFMADKELAARIAPPIKAIEITTTSGDAVNMKELQEQLVEMMELYKRDQ